MIQLSSVLGVQKVNYSTPAAGGQQTLTRGVDFILGLIVFRVTLHWWNGSRYRFTPSRHPKKLICEDTLIICVTHFDYFCHEFMSLRGQMHITKHILEMNATLARFRDPMWCTQPQLDERMWLCESHWRSSQRLITFGTPFFCFLENSKFNIIFSITWCKLCHMLKLTLTLLACYDWGHNRSPSGHTWP